MKEDMKEIAFWLSAIAAVLTIAIGLAWLVPLDYQSTLPPGAWAQKDIHGHRYYEYIHSNGTSLVHDPECPKCQER